MIAGSQGARDYKRGTAMTFSRDFTGFMHINECGVNVKTLQSLKCDHSTSYDILEKILITIDYV